ncbi:MAG: Fe-S cluster assembly protein NifU [Planctomycetes bacterium]|nr:Fe-S cluster assembly protein NifU [Planctomycetota bacterium]
MWNYSKKVLDHFQNPHNYGDMENPDAVAEVGSISCGDALRLALKIDKNTGRIIDAKFQTFGCGSAIASSSALTDMVKGKTLEEAMKITNEDIADYLGGLPKEKMHCSVMGKEALEAAVANYKGVKPEKKEEGRLVCHCFGITEEKIRKVAIENHLTTVDEITNYTKAGGGCGNCKPEIEEILADVWSKVKAAAPKVQPVASAVPKKLTNIQKMQMIQDVIEHEIKPSLQADGGSIELIDVEGNKVLVAMRGTCSVCMHSQTTIKGFVESKLREFVSPDITVEEV